MNKVFITGRAGYVGAVLTPYLLSKGHKVSVIDLMIYGRDVLKIHTNLRLGGIKAEIRTLQSQHEGNVYNVEK